MSGNTWGAGTADVQGVVQCSDSVLNDVLSLSDCRLQKCKLLFQQLLLQLLLMTRLQTHSAKVTLAQCWYMCIKLVPPK